MADTGGGGYAEVIFRAGFERDGKSGIGLVGVGNATAIGLSLCACPLVNCGEAGGEYPRICPQRAEGSG